MINVNVNVFILVFIIIIQKVSRMTRQLEIDYIIVNLYINSINIIQMEEEERKKEEKIIIIFF